MNETTIVFCKVFEVNNRQVLVEKKQGDLGESIVALRWLSSRYSVSFVEFSIDFADAELRNQCFDNVNADVAADVIALTECQIELNIRAPISDSRM